MKQQRILLAGATGYLGRYIAKELAEKEYPTRLLVRDLAKAGFDSKEYEIVSAGITEPVSLKGVCRDIDVVISTIGITKQKDGLTYMDVDYQGNLNLLNEAKMSGVKKFIYVSAFNGEKLTHLKIGEAKEKFVSEVKKSSMDFCILRPNGFFSDMTEFLSMAKKGTVNLFGDGSFRMNPIHGADLAELCVEAITSDKREIEVGGPEVYTHNAIADFSFSTLEKESKIKYMPNWMRKTFLGLTRTFTSSKTYGPLEFFFTVLAMDMVAPEYGKRTLENYFEEQKSNIL